MASFHGLNGVVKVGSDQIAQIREFSFDEMAETSDSSVMGATYRDYLPGLKSWSGSLTCFLDLTDVDGQAALSSGAVVNLVFQPEGNSSGDVKYSGTATITKRGVKANVDGVVEISFDFLGKGALTQGTIT